MSKFATAFSAALILGTCSWASLAAESANGEKASSAVAASQDAASEPADLHSLARHPFLYAGEWQNRSPRDQKMYLVREGKIVWTYNLPFGEYGDAWRLSNGNILFSRREGASEITPDGETVWNYDAPKKFEVHTSQPIGLDRVFLVQNGDPAKAMIINKKTGAVEKELVVKTKTPNAHGQFRHCRFTKAGTFLMAHSDLDKVVEYDPATGKAIWSVAAPKCWAAVRLNNGNTLISGNQEGYVREVNPKGDIVWEINRNDLPGIPLYVVQECSRLANGNTILCNWTAHAPEEEKDRWVQVIEVTPEKKVVWALKQWADPNLGPASALQLLDEPGVAENNELQR